MGLIADKLYRHLRRNPPRMSTTEREAISAGGTWIDRDIFSGRIPWYSLHNGLVSIDLTNEEQEFLDGPVQELCEMLNDDQINKDADLPVHIWTFLKDNRFFGMNIDKDHGGLGFSARAQSEVVIPTRLVREN